MQTSATGRAFIEAFEGKFLNTYDDGTGVLTIGYGHTSAAGPPAVVRGQAITEAQCDAILAADLGKVEADVAKLIKVPMTQPQFDALVSFHFNTGALGSGSIDDKINAGNPNAAMVTLLQYDHAGGKVMAGLTRRRKAERLMFLGDVAGSLTLAGAHMAAATVMPQSPQVRPPTALAAKPDPAPVVQTTVTAPMLPPTPISNPAPPQMWLVQLIVAVIAAFTKRKP